MSTTADPIPQQWNWVQRQALIVGIAALVLCILCGLVNPAQAFRSYLVAYLFWTGIPVGCLAILMMQYLTGGAWGLVIRRLTEAGTRTLLVMTPLFLPVLIGLPILYIWARPAAVAHDPLLQHKQVYLNVPFFVIRAVIYFVVWAGLAYLLNRWSREQDRTASRRPGERSESLSGPGMVLYGLTVTFAAVDWVMSLEPHWYSTIYGAVFSMTQILSALAFAIAGLTLLADRKPLSEILTPTILNDLGNMMLAFLMLWAYMAFSQFLLTWSGNLPEEIIWYLPRLAGGWRWVALALALVYFGLPFFLLLSRDIKRSPRRLGAVALLIVFMSFIDMLWMIAPAPLDQAGLLHWYTRVLGVVAYFAATIGLGGVWLATFVWQVQGRPLLPLHDPALQEVYNRHE